MRYCEICGEPGAVKHHWFTRKRYGEAAECEENWIWLEHFGHHTESHDIGQKTFAEKYGLMDRYKKARQEVWKRSRRITAGRIVCQRR